MRNFFVLSALMLVALSASTARAAFISSGDDFPAAPSSWTSSTDGYIGKTTNGALIVDGGSDLLSGYGFLGYENNTIGMATVSGAGSTWTSGNLYVGFYGIGTLNITNGGSVNNTNCFIGTSNGSTGTVTVSGAGSTFTNNNLYVGNSGIGTLNIINGSSVSTTSSTHVGFDGDSTGAINFGTSGGILTTQSLLASPSQLTGSGTINARGLVSDIEHKYIPYVRMYIYVHYTNKALKHFSAIANDNQFQG